MGLDVAIGTFQIDTAKTVGQTQDIVISPAFTPKALIIWGMGRTVAAGVGRGNVHAQVAFSSGTYTSNSYTWSADAGAKSDSGCESYNGRLVTAWSADGVVDGYANFTQFNADGFRITIWRSIHHRTSSVLHGYWWK